MYDFNPKLVVSMHSHLNHGYFDLLRELKFLEHYHLRFTVENWPMAWAFLDIG